MKANKYDSFYVTVTVEDCPSEWDGDEPLDPNKDWTPYNLMLYGRKNNCEACGESGDDVVLDSLGGTWASDDMDGREHIESTISDYFLGTIEGVENAPTSIEDLEIIYE